MNALLTIVLLPVFVLLSLPSLAQAGWGRTTCENSSGAYFYIGKRGYPTKETFSFQSQQLAGISAQLGVDNDIVGVAQNGLWVSRDEKGIRMESSFYLNSAWKASSSEVPARLNHVEMASAVVVTIQLHGVVLLTEYFPKENCKFE